MREESRSDTRPHHAAEPQKQNPRHGGNHDEGKKAGKYVSPRQPSTKPNRKKEKNMYTFIESRIDWSFYKHSVDKTPEATTFKILMRGQAQDIRESTTSDGHVYRSEQTDLFSDRIAAVATLIITRYHKGGQLMKDRIVTRLVPAVTSIINGKGEIFFTDEEADRVINEAAQKFIAAISENGGFMLPRPLTVGGKAILNAAARKKDQCRLEVGGVTTRIADRNKED